MKAETNREHNQGMRENDREYRQGLLEVQREGNTIYKEHLAEQMAFEKRKAGELRNLTPYPDLLTSWELASYGNAGRLMHRLQDTCTYVDNCIMQKCHAAAFEELGGRIKAACKASATTETITDGVSGQTFQDSFVNAHSLDQLWKTVEDGCQLPTSLVACKHDELTRHWGMPSTFTQGTVSQGVALPALPCAPTVQEQEDCDEQEAVRTGLEQLKHVNDCLQKVTACIESHADAIRNCTEFLDNLALNRARQNVMHTRLQQTGVYLPDVTHRINLEQMLKASSLPKKAMPSRDELWRKRQGFREVGECEVCGSPVRFHDYERAHVVASQQGKAGTNGEHNLLVACRDCNQNMGTCDALLYKDRLLLA
jgi:5-methylcytosine-specific restriction endonuclease McrA